MAVVKDDEQDLKPNKKKTTPEEDELDKRHINYDYGPSLFKSIVSFLNFLFVSSINNPTFFPLFDDDKTNKVAYELHHKATTSPKVEM
ncbi:hypothetical protein Tco_1284736 [Tanacetum coccineum]